MRQESSMIQTSDVSTIALRSESEFEEVDFAFEGNSNGVSLFSTIDLNFLFLLPQSLSISQEISDMLKSYILGYNVALKTPIRTDQWLCYLGGSSFPFRFSNEEIASLKYYARQVLNSLLIIVSYHLLNDKLQTGMQEVYRKSCELLSTLTQSPGLSGKINAPTFQIPLTKDYYCLLHCAYSELSETPVPIINRSYFDFLYNYKDIKTKKTLCRTLQYEVIWLISTVLAVDRNANIDDIKKLKEEPIETALKFLLAN